MPDGCNDLVITFLDFFPFAFDKVKIGVAASPKNEITFLYLGTVNQVFVHFNETKVLS